MQAKTKTFNQASATFSRPSATTNGRWTLTKHELGYSPHNVYSVHQITVLGLVDSDDNARWGVSIASPGSGTVVEHTTAPIAGGAGATVEDTVTIENVLAEVIQVDIVGLDADGACQVHIVSRPRGLGN